jgi:hypothetical protein
MFFNLCNIRVQCAGSPTNNTKKKNPDFILKTKSAVFSVFYFSIVHVKCSTTGLQLPSFIQHSWIKLGFLLTNHIPRIKGHSSRKISSIRLTKLIDLLVFYANSAIFQLYPDKRSCPCLYGANQVSRIQGTCSKVTDETLLTKFVTVTDGQTTGARCVRKKKKNYIILQGGELTCFHFFKSSC